MPTYFAGNVLPPRAERTSQDPTFRFSQNDAETLRLVGKPIRLEHEKALTVGTVVKQMKDRTGRVFVVGRIDAEDAGVDHRAARVFADKALENGLYQSLSLQHEHSENLDGSDPRKTAVEVSLVNEPRRPNCDIGCVRRHTAHAASAKNTDYIGAPAKAKDNPTSALSPPTHNTTLPAMSATPTPSPAAAEGGVPGENTAATPATPAPSKTAPAANATPALAAAAADGDTYKTADIVNVVVEQVRQRFRAGRVDAYCVIASPCCAFVFLCSDAPPPALCRNCNSTRSARKSKRCRSGTRSSPPPTPSARASPGKKRRRSARRTPRKRPHFSKP